jgi:hypothetical protein
MITNLVSHKKQVGSISLVNYRSDEARITSLPTKRGHEEAQSGSAGEKGRECVEKKKTRTK